MWCINHSMPMPQQITFYQCLRSNPIKCKTVFKGFFKYFLNGMAICMEVSTASVILNFWVHFLGDISQLRHWLSLLDILFKAFLCMQLCVPAYAIIGGCAICFFNIMNLIYCIIKFTSQVLTFHQLNDCNVRYKQKHIRFKSNPKT